MCVPAPHAAASDISQSMEVRLEVLSTCSLTSTSSIALQFGTQQNFGQPTAADIDGRAALQVTCTADSDWSVYADLGENPGGADQRRVLNGATGTYVPYDLYSDEARSIPFGSTPATAISGSGSAAAPTDVVVYGRIPAGAPLGATGLYRDSVVLTFSF
jgi:spore coat protein U-like protein